jgi:hypothetical protein
MIANQQELEIVSQQLQQLKGQRDSILRRSGDDAPFRSHVEIAGIEKMIARLQQEVDAYEQTKGTTSEALSQTGT